MDNEEFLMEDESSFKEDVKNMLLECGLQILLFLLIATFALLLFAPGILGIVNISTDIIESYNENVSVETYTVSCKVIEKHETTESNLDVASGLLMGFIRYKDVTTYLVVLESNGNLYEVEVEEELYNQIEVGEMRMCEIVISNNQLTQKHSSHCSILEK